MMIANDISTDQEEFDTLQVLFADNTIECAVNTRTNCKDRLCQVKVKIPDNEFFKSDFDNILINEVNCLIIKAIKVSTLRNTKKILLVNRIMSNLLSLEGS